MFHQMNLTAANDARIYRETRAVRLERYVVRGVR